jgi:hypothetical protein
MCPRYRGSRSMHQPVADNAVSRAEDTPPRLRDEVREGAVRLGHLRVGGAGRRTASTLGLLRKPRQARSLEPSSWVQWYPGSPQWSSPRACSTGWQHARWAGRPHASDHLCQCGIPLIRHLSDCGPEHLGGGQAQREHALAGARHHGIRPPARTSSSRTSVFIDEAAHENAQSIFDNFLSRYGEPIKHQTQ